MKTVIIADNHPLLRSGVRQLIDNSGLFKVLAEAGNGESCVIQVEDLKPDWLVLDLNIPGMSGFEVVRALKTRGAGCRIAILTMHSSQEFVAHARAIGCDAFIAKEDAGQELLAILNSESDAFRMSSSAGKGEGDLPEQMHEEPAGLPVLAALSKSELRILREIADARTSEAIAAALHVSVRTVHTHRQNICRKLDLKGVNSLLRFALENREAILNQ